MADLMEEVQSILGNTPEDKKPAAPVTEMKDPSDEAFDLLKTGANLSKMLQKKLDAVSKAMGDAKQQAERLQKLGAGGAIESPRLIGGKPLSALKDLQSLVSGAASQIERLVKDANRGRGSLGFRESQESYLDWLDARVDSLSEIRKPKPDSPPDNAGVNDYSSELVAAAKAAAGYINSSSALSIGSSVHIGRKALSVVGAPKMVDQGILVHLEPPSSAEAHHNLADAYTLMIPMQGKNSAPPSMTTPQQSVQATAEAVLTLGDRSVKILAADLRLEAGDYGDHMTNYGDYGPAMGRIKPGDKVAGILTPTVFRVIGKSGNSALVQPDSMDKEMYGRFKGAAQYSRTPVGQSTPSVPSVDLWKPGMGRIPAGQDFPGRGGKVTQDTSTSAPKPTGGVGTGGGRTSLAGTRVLNYNPHDGKYKMATGKMPGDYEMADTIQVVGHDPAMPTAVGEGLTIDAFEYALNEAEGDDVIAKLGAVIESDRPMKVNGVLMDPDVAAVMVQFHGSVSGENRARMEAMSVHEMLDVSQKMLLRLTEASSKPQSDLKKKVEPHMWVVIEDKKGHFLVTIGDPKKPGSKVKFSGDKADLKDWARDNIGRKVSEDHVIDLTKNKLVPDTYSKWYVETQMKGGKGKKEEVDADATIIEFRNSRTAERAAEILGETIDGAEHKVEGSELSVKLADGDLDTLKAALRDARISFDEK